MANVWKVGSRWSDNGAPESSILHIFRRNGYVFVGSQEFGEQVHKGDYIAIADGYRVVSVAKVLDDDPTELRELITSHKLRFRDSDAERFDFRHPEYWSGKEGYYGTRVHIVDLLPDETFLYKKMSRFHVANLYWNEIKSLYDNSGSKPFDIASKTYRLKNITGMSDPKGYEKGDLLDGKTFYNIPVYQREYSWGEEEVGRFVRDIFNGYWGAVPDADTITKDPLFIGTMQLSQKQYVSDTEYEQDIIDGQQRISTLLCFLKYLKIAFPESSVLRGLSFDWLHTNVNNFKEDELLQELRGMESAEDLRTDSLNIYVRNCALIGQLVQQAVTDEDERPLPFFSVDDFCAYLFTSIYFVAVETVAGLSKTIQIFNTINTAGLDLNGDDIFKVRLYEYLHDVCREGEDCFNDIGEAYKRVKVINDGWRKDGNDYDVVSIWSVRDAYKDYIISTYNLSDSLYSMATDTFFDRLFDVLLDVQAHKEFGKAAKDTVKVSLEDFNRVIDAVAEWNMSSFESREEVIAYRLIQKSRYSRYLRICYLLVLYGFSIRDVYRILTPLSKIYLCHSRYNAKAINEIHRFTYGLQKQIARGGSLDSLLSVLMEKLDAAKEWCGHFRGPMPANRPTWRDLVCCLSAYLDEDDTPVDILDKKLTKGTGPDGYSYEYDFEHIHAWNDTSLTVNDDLQDSIGNLVLLESTINRSLQDSPFDKKVDRDDGRPCYKDSRFKSVAKIRLAKKWDEEEIVRRLDAEYRRILGFIWGDNDK